MTRPILKLSLLALVGLSACGRPPVELTDDVEAEARRFAEAVCETRATCDCADGRFESQATCESEFFGNFMSKVDEGMAFDADCLDSLLDSEAMTCAVWPWTYEEQCRVLSRERGLGKPCEWSRDLAPATTNDCAEGLYCFNGTCTDEVTFELEVGEPCKLDIGQPCVKSAYCGADGVCHARALLGEPCTDFFGCETGMFCADMAAEGVGTCTEHLVVGEVCDPRDRLPCAFTLESPWPSCVLADDGEYRCAEEGPGICYVSFPPAHP